MQRLLDEKDKKIEGLEWEILKLKHELQENKEKVKEAEKKILSYQSHSPIVLNKVKTYVNSKNLQITESPSVEIPSGFFQHTPNSV